MNDGNNQSLLDLLKPSAPGEDKKWYEGSMIPSDFVQALKPFVDFLPVCAEMEIDLGVTRDTVRNLSVDGEIRLMQPATTLDVTAKMRDFSSRFLASLPKVDGFIRGG